MWLYWQEDEEAEVASDVSEQEVHQEALQRQFYGRAKLLSGAVEKVQQVQTKGGLMLVEGTPGEGKTVFMVNYFKHCCSSGAYKDYRIIKNHINKDLNSERKEPYLSWDTGHVNLILITVLSLC